MWEYPATRYYYDWYGEVPPEVAPTDGAIKSIVVDRLRNNAHTLDEKLRVDVKRGVVILTGEVESTLAKRAAGDDAWDTPGVLDVSNQLVVRAGSDATVRELGDARMVREVMTPDPLCVPASTPALDVARGMRNADVGAVIVTQDGAATGIVTDRDLVVRMVAEGEPLTTPAGEIASHHLATVSPRDPIETAVRLMREHAVRRLPVVDDHRPVGIVSLGDLAMERDPQSVLADISAAAPTR